MKTKFCIATIIITNLLSFSAFFLLKPNFILQILNLIIMLFCQISTLLSDKGTRNHAFPIDIIAERALLFALFFSSLSLPKYTYNDIPFNGYNFNDLVILPIALYLLLSFINESEKKYHFLEKESKLRNWLPFLCTTFLQLAFYYILYYDTIVKGIVKTYTLAQYFHIIHLTALLYSFVAIALYFLSFFSYVVEIKEKIKPFYSLKDTTIFVAVYLFIIIWSLTSLRISSTKADFLIFITYGIFIFVHILILLKTKKVEGFNSSFIFNINVAIILIFFVSFCLIQCISHLIFFKTHIAIIICSIILIIIFILFIFFLSNTEDANRTDEEKQ